MSRDQHKLFPVLRSGGGVPILLGLVLLGLTAAPARAQAEREQVLILIDRSSSMGRGALPVDGRRLRPYDAAVTAARQEAAIHLKAGRAVHVVTFHTESDPPLGPYQVAQDAPTEPQLAQLVADLNGRRPRRSGVKTNLWTSVSELIKNGDRTGIGFANLSRITIYTDGEASDQGRRGDVYQKLARAWNIDEKQVAARLFQFRWDRMGGLPPFATVRFADDGPLPEKGPRDFANGRVTVDVPIQGVFSDACAASDQITVAAVEVAPLDPNFPPMQVVTAQLDPPLTKARPNGVLRVTLAGSLPEGRFEYRYLIRPELTFAAAARRGIDASALRQSVRPAGSKQLVIASQATVNLTVSPGADAVWLEPGGVANFTVAVSGNAEAADLPCTLKATTFKKGVAVSFLRPEDAADPNAEVSPNEISALLPPGGKRTNFVARVTATEPGPAQITLTASIEGSKQARDVRLEVARPRVEASVASEDATEIPFSPDVPAAQRPWKELSYGPIMFKGVHVRDPKAVEVTATIADEPGGAVDLAFDDKGTRQARLPLSQASGLRLFGRWRGAPTGEITLPEIRFAATVKGGSYTPAVKPERLRPRSSAVHLNSPMLTSVQPAEAFEDQQADDPGQMGMTVRDNLFAGSATATPDPKATRRILLEWNGAAAVLAPHIDVRLTRPSQGRIISIRSDDPDVLEVVDEAALLSTGRGRLKIHKAQPGGTPAPARGDDEPEEGEGPEDAQGQSNSASLVVELEPPQRAGEWALDLRFQMVTPAAAARPKPAVRTPAPGARPTPPGAASPTTPAPGATSQQSAAASPVWQVRYEFSVLPRLIQLALQTPQQALEFFADVELPVAEVTAASQGVAAGVVAEVTADNPAVTFETQWRNAQQAVLPQLSVPEGGEQQARLWVVPKVATDKLLQLADKPVTATITVRSADGQPVLRGPGGEPVAELAPTTFAGRLQVATIKVFYGEPATETTRIPPVLRQGPDNKATAAPRWAVEKVGDVHRTETYRRPLFIRVDNVPESLQDKLGEQKLRLRPVAAEAGKTATAPAALAATDTAGRFTPRFRVDRGGKEPASVEEITLGELRGGKVKGLELTAGPALAPQGFSARPESGRVVIESADPAFPMRSATLAVAIDVMPGGGSSGRVWQFVLGAVALAALAWIALKFKDRFADKPAGATTGPAGGDTRELNYDDTADETPSYGGPPSTGAATPPPPGDKGQSSSMSYDE